MLFDNVKIITYKTYPDHKGGASLYAWYLQRCFPGSAMYGWDGSVSKNDVPEQEKAKILNKSLLEKGLIKKGDIVIGDGVWGNIGLPSNDFKLISVCHGPWARTIDHKSPLALAQKKGFSRSKVVSVSPSVKEQCKVDYGIDSYVIWTGLDTIFWDSEKTVKKDILWLSSKWNELRDFKRIVKRILSNYNHIEISSYDDRVNKELYNKAKVFVHVTSYEGNSFAILKSLACNTPVVSNAMGLFQSADFVEKNQLGRVCRRDPYEASETIRACYHKTLHPRRWIVENCTLDMFSKKWRSFVEI